MHSLAYENIPCGSSVAPVLDNRPSIVHGRIRCNQLLVAWFVALFHAESFTNPGPCSPSSHLLPMCNKCSEEAPAGTK